MMVRAKLIKKIVIVSLLPLKVSKSPRKVWRETLVLAQIIGEMLGHYYRIYYLCTPAATTRELITPTISNDPETVAA